MPVMTLDELVSEAKTNFAKSRGELAVEYKAEVVTRGDRYKATCTYGYGGARIHLAEIKQG